MDFGKWIGVHDSSAQQRRLERAKQAPCTPLSISHEERSGVFSGEHGVYHTTLEKCPCADFTRRNLPCKHMYRLAIELGLIDEAAESDISKVRRPAVGGLTYAEAGKVIEQLSDKAREFLQATMYDLFYRNEADITGVRACDELVELVNAGVLEVFDVLKVRLRAYKRNELRDRLISAGITQFNKNMRHDLLVQWICDNVPEASEIFSDMVSVRITDKHLASARSIYSYLIRRDSLGAFRGIFPEVYEVDKNGERIDRCPVEERHSAGDKTNRAQGVNDSDDIELRFLPEKRKRYRTASYVFAVMTVIYFFMMLSNSSAAIGVALGLGATAFCLLQSMTNKEQTRFSINGKVFPLSRKATNWVIWGAAILLMLILANTLPSSEPSEADSGCILIESSATDISQ